MPPRLPSFPAFKDPSAFMARIARPFSATPAVAEPRRPISNTDSLLGLDDQKAPIDRARTLMSKNPLGGARNAALRQRTMLDSLKKQKISDDYLKQMPRRWRNGNVYAPHDLSPTEMDKWRRIRKPEVDVIDMLGINPKDHYRNFAMVSEFMTSFGHIMHSKDTGLRPVNHRRMTKAIRRAIGMGIHPSVHHHPEILKKTFKQAWR
ncbi:37S ribosomal protein RSM18 [Colletotrichum sp. SAR11_59]|uniref:Small ribosomal subunit protein bS18m n=1 Tax=Colletotrichum asianum TaxID=702518 RepID=A0A8H3W2Z9_9PEZI|nr:37s ribosomal protein s18 [Colletotrichum asianum]KAI8304051.1 37S ribosomal protein RSM18 [Colletotrichum sp. SAR11_59]